jgi:cation transport ATPase
MIYEWVAKATTKKLSQQREIQKFVASFAVVVVALTLSLFCWAKR